MRRKKILYIHHAGGLGGAPKSLAYLIKGLDRTKYDPIVLCIKDGPVVDFFKKNGIATIVKHNKLACFHGTTVSGMSIRIFIKNILGLFVTLLNAKSILTDINPDIIHLNTSCLFPIAFFSKRYLRNVKVISHIREPLLSNLFGKILQWGNLKYVDEFVAISKNDALPFNHSGKVKVVYNFVNLDDYNRIDSNLKEELGIDKKDIVFTYLSRIQEGNGALELLNASKILKGNFKIIFLGVEDNDDSSYAKKLRNQQSDKILMLGLQKDIKPILSITDVAISPFTKDHFSRAVVEAGAMKIPSIVSDVNSLNEQVIDGLTGIIYPHNDITRLANAMNKMLDGDVRIEMGQKAYKFIEDEFNAKKNIKRTCSVYN